MAGIYIHIPFCRQACHYCDFHFSTNLDSKYRLVKAIIRELQMRKDYMQRLPVETIYFGGGTPSILTKDELPMLLESVRSTFDVQSDAEITLEANPDDLDGNKLDQLYKAGVNRLSIGIQSFDDEVLRFMNRAHDARSALICIGNSRAAGFKNISIDLMYALPGQSHAGWKKNIDIALDLEPEHISAYSLTVEEKTVFGHQHRTGKLHTVDEEFASIQFEDMMTTLEEGGYQHYEISNFSLPEKHSRHNSGYWNQQLYLGVGPGAHSFDRDSRQWNVSNNNLYMTSIEAGNVPAEIEVLNSENKINEYIFTTLRTSWGCDLTKLQNDLGWNLQKENGRYLRELQDRSLVTIDNNILTLTRTGKLLADKIAADLFADSVTHR